MHKIIETLWVGNIYEACLIAKNEKQHPFDVIINCMDFNEMGKYERDDYSINKKSSIFHIPVLKSDFNEKGIVTDIYIEPFAAYVVASTINSALLVNKQVFIHCAAGEERSPLMVIWFLYKYRYFTLPNALQYVKDLHPQTRNRLSWLNRALGINLFKESIND